LDEWNNLQLSAQSANNLHSDYFNQLQHASQCYNEFEFNFNERINQLIIHYGFSDNLINNYNDSDKFHNQFFIYHSFSNRLFDSNSIHKFNFYGFEFKHASRYYNGRRCCSASFNELDIEQPNHNEFEFNFNAINQLIID
jgi:hypothetical protein